MKQKFFVGGMTCTACSLGIEKALNKTAGVSLADVSLMDKSMLVEYDEKVISAESLMAIVQKLGYRAELYDENLLDKYAESKTLRNRFFVSLILLVPLMYFSMGAMLGLPAFDNKINFILQWIFATLIILINFKFYINGIKAVVNLSPNMYTLVSLGSFSAYVFSVWVVLATFLQKTAPNHTFFEASAMVLALVTLGKWFEERSKIKTGDAVEKLGTLIPKVVTVIKDGKEQDVMVTSLNVGDVVVIKAGEYIPVDGEIIDGNASVDKSAITGESMPEEVSVGNFITSGSILKSGYLQIKAQKVGQDTLFSKIIETVKIAGASKAPIQKTVDKVSAFFVPTVTAIALLVFTLWLLISGDLSSAVNYGISVLVISCPCALGLATPVAVMVATGRSASQGVLFKDASALQKTRMINCVLLDKTATLTVGKPNVTNFDNYSAYTDKQIFSIVSALESKSSHPLAECIVGYCGESDLTVEDYQYYTGLGMSGCVDDTVYYLGNYEFIYENVRQKPNSRLFNDYDGKTVVCLASEKCLLAIFAISDVLKEDSAQAVKELKSLGIKTVMITGDRKSVAEHVAKQTDIDHFESDVLPKDKFDIVEKYKKDGYFVCMVGDGINDSPALKGSDVGIAMGTGTDVAIDSADVVIANGSLFGVVKAMSISKKVMRIIKQNLFWAFFYNLLAIPIAGGALSFVGITLTPALASALMSCSSLFVVTNALRINQREKTDKACTERYENQIKLVIEGMMCKHCQAKVFDALSKISGVKTVDVNLKTNTATVGCVQTVTVQQLKNVVEDMGYKVTKII